MGRIIEYAKHLRPKGYILYSSIVSVSGFLNGYDTGSIGALTAMPYFAINIQALSPVMHGFTVSLIMITGALPSIFGGQLADRYGQLYVVMAGAIVFTIGAVLEATSIKLAMLLVGRALAGAGQGLWLSNVSVYITEIAPSAKRGSLVAMPQLMAACGICAGYFTCYGTVHIESSLSWRTPFILQAVLGTVLAMSCLYLPTSPRWLCLNHRREDAMAALERLDIPEAEAEKDILRPVEPGPPRKLSAGDFLMIFKKQYRGQTMLGLFILGMIQLCGIDGVLYYAPTLFAQAGLSSSTASFLASGVSAILIVCISIPAFIYADRWGRRTSAITGGVVLSACMLIIGIFYATGSVKYNSGAGRWVVIVLIFVFALSYAATWAVVGKIYASEIQPAQTRAAANSLAQGVNFFANWLIAFTTPIFLAHSAYGAYFLFGAFSLLSVVVLAISMPETRGYSLEVIQERFQASRPRRVGWKIQKLLSGPSLNTSEQPIASSTEGVLTGHFIIDLGSV